MNVKNIFLQGTLKEELYIILPYGHKNENNTNLTCRLYKLIYVLKQYSCTWNKKFSSYLISYNFKISSADHSLFVKHHNLYIIIVLMYVDDIIIIDNNQNQIT
jgi:Reverse transcriptase (RNA-dependent DNA polymerase)